MIYKLGQVCSRLSSGKSISSKLISSKGTFPVYGGNGLRGYTDKYNFDGECAIIGRQGAFCGNVRFFSGKAYMTEHAIVVCADDKNDTRYLAYLLSSLHLGRLSGQSAQPGLSVKVLSQQEIDLPDLEYQKKVSMILSLLEKKISLNEMINRNLLEQLKVIFSQMFPNITDNGSNTLEEIIFFSNGKKRPDTEGKVPVYGGNGILSYTDKSNAENCVIIGRVGAYCGSLYLSVEPCWISDNAIKAEAKNSKSQMFIYYLLQELALSNRHIGTSQPLLTQGILNAIPFKCPSEEGIISFCKKADDIRKLIDMNTIENKRLSELRDTLLPKLMSGELDVSNLDI